VYMRCPFNDLDSGNTNNGDARTLTYNIQHYIKQRVEENLDQLSFDLKGKRVTVVVNSLAQTDDDGKISVTFFASKWTQGFLYQDAKNKSTTQTTITKLLNWKDCQYKLELTVKLIHVTFFEKDTSWDILCYPFVNIKTVTLIKKKNAKQGDSELDAKKKCQSLTADIDAFLASQGRQRIVGEEGGHSTLPSTFRMATVRATDQNPLSSEPKPSFEFITPKPSHKRKAEAIDVEVV
jgi:hypothetical protein